VHPDTFKYNTQLKFISLSENLITQVHVEIFKYNIVVEELDLSRNQITQMHPDFAKNLPLLTTLHIYDNPLGCVVVPDHVSLVSDYLWGSITPRQCPNNCTVNTYYNQHEHTCQNCPYGFYTTGVGAINCTALAQATESVYSPLCHGDTLPFSNLGDTICVPKNIYPSSDVVHRNFDKKWGDIKMNRSSFKTGGLGKKTTPDQWEVWVCDINHPSVRGGGDSMCFTFSEENHVFVPWGLNSVLRVVKS